MKLNVKMMLLFSAMMLAAVAILSSYSTQLNIDSFTDLSNQQFHNISHTVSEALDQQISLMDLVLEELLDNASFMAAINQFVRDDSDDRKVGTAARNTVLQLLYRSPLVENFYRVSFYTRSGDFVTSRFEKDDYLVSGTERAGEVISALPWLDEVDRSPTQRHILASHSDFFAVRRDMQVYGIVRAVVYHGNALGYLEVSNEFSELESIMAIASQENASIQVGFDDGTLLYSSTGTPLPYPADMPEDQIVDWSDPALGISQSVVHTRVEWLNLSLYVAKDNAIIEASLSRIYQTIIRTSIFILIPTLALIALVSMRLTQSIRQLTRKVQQSPVDSSPGDEASIRRALSTTVTSTGDPEIHELELTFNNLMLKQRESTLNEIAMREGTLQAQLSALQMQINPHFVYNTLNIISAKSMESGNYDVIEICDQFAQMLRYSTDTRSRTATMAEELENARYYLMLSKARYEDNLEFTIDVPENLTSLTVPKLTLQPLVENALSHGFNGANALRKLWITGHIEKAHFILEIRDNGNGFSEDSLSRLRRQIEQVENNQLSIQSGDGHIGLINTCLRLHYYSKGTMHMSIRNENGAVVTLTFLYDGGMPAGQGKAL